MENVQIRALLSLLTPLIRSWDEGQVQAGKKMKTIGEIKVSGGFFMIWMLIFPLIMSQHSINFL